MQHSGQEVRRVVRHSVQRVQPFGGDSHQFAGQHFGVRYDLHQSAERLSVWRHAGQIVYRTQVCRTVKLCFSFSPAHYLFYDFTNVSGGATDLRWPFTVVCHSLHSRYLAVFCGFLLGLSDTGFTTQVYNFIGVRYPENIASATSLFLFVQV